VRGRGVPRLGFKKGEREKRVGPATLKKERRRLGLGCFGIEKNYSKIC